MGTEVWRRRVLVKNTTPLAQRTWKPSFQKGEFPIKGQCRESEIMMFLDQSIHFGHSLGSRYLMDMVMFTFLRWVLDSLYIVLSKESV